MIRYLEGDLFKSPAQTIVNAVNTVGVMGKGIALEFKNRYPDMFQAYRTACENGKLNIGNLMLYYEPDYWVLLFPTKRNWRNASKLEYIEAGLEKFRRSYADFGITSVAFPKLGCGNGELDWEDVKPLMEKKLKDLPIDIYIYLSQVEISVPEHKNQKEMALWLRQNARDLSFNGICDDLSYNYSIIPLTFKSSGKDYQMIWNHGLDIKDAEGKSINISEEDFFSLWDRIRSRGVFGQSEKHEDNIVYDLLCSTGYLSAIRFANNNAVTKMGYQVNEGIGRAYSLTVQEDAV